MFVSSLLSVKFTSFLALGRCYFVGGRGGERQSHEKQRHKPLRFRAAFDSFAHSIELTEKGLLEVF